MRFSSLSLVLLTFSAIQLLTSCNDDPTTLGLDLLPTNEHIYVNSNDTISVSVNNEYLNLNEPLPKGDTIMLGVYNDVIFGTTKASLITEFTPVNAINNYKAYKIADSIYINLQSEYFAGGKGWKIKFKVFQLKNLLSQNTDYYRNIPIENFVDTTSKPLAEVLVDFRTSPIRIDLPKDFAQKILNLLDTNILNKEKNNIDDALFRNSLSANKIFNGFYFLPDKISGPGAIATYDMDAYDNYGYFKNYMIINFHTNETIINKDTIKADTTYIKFGFFSQSRTSKNFYPKVNIFNHYEYRNTKIYDVLNGTKDDSVLFIQSAQGVKVKLNIAEGLNNIKNSYKKTLFDIGQAELAIPFDTIFYSHYIPNITSRMPRPLHIVLSVIDKNDKIMSYSSIFKPYYDGFVYGYPDTKRSAYILNISQYVQEYLNNTTDIENILLEPVNSNITLSSTIIKKSNIQLKIKYITFNKN